MNRTVEWHAGSRLGLLRVWLAMKILPRDCSLTLNVGTRLLKPGRYKVEKDGSFTETPSHNAGKGV